MRKLAAGFACFCVLLLVPGSADAQSSRPVVNVIQIGGLLDRVQADFWLHAIDDAEALGAAALIVQLDSSRSVLSSTRFAELSGSIRNAKTPVGIWVGPARSGHVGGDVVKLLQTADVVGLAPGASIDATKPGVDVRSPTLGDFLVDLDGKARISIPTKVIRNKGETPHREPLVDVRFAKPSLTARTVHGVTSPGPAYALLMAGLLLAVLEFATAGIGLAAGTAAILLLLGALGLGGLPTNPFGVVALVFAVFGFSVDLQAGAPRFWTAIGTGAMVLGTFTLFSDGMHVPLIWVVAVFGLTAAFVLAGLPSLIRARFSSPTIGREGFVGEVGAAVGTLHPEGLVSIRGATWRARTNRATPVEDGAAIRVIGIDGLVLDVEPEEGGAKDYREHSKPST
ncbi:MAG: hypothetical protein H0U92_11735 [Actinobacteria bacterium]|nr:hypothetical protein [Actinomycetota bacterium]